MLGGMVEDEGASGGVGTDEEVKRRGRKSNLERLRMERCTSAGNLIGINEM